VFEDLLPLSCTFEASSVFELGFLKVEEACYTFAMAFRILVRDTQEAVDWYVDHLGFAVVESWGPAFSILEKDGDELWVSGPQTSAAKPMPDGRQPEPGGWNRPVIQVENLGATMEKLRSSGAVFRNEPLAGPGGTQVLVDDPSGNPVEIFQSRDE
jgi:catechol 2,3-dioxygenase-like lactoylglutathione lyase family enzyme